MTKEQPRIQHLNFGVAVLILVVAILFFGLKSQRWHVENDIQWLPDSNTLKIRNPGMAYVDDVHSLDALQFAEDFTIHVGLTPKNSLRRGFRPILMLHDGDDHLQLALWQWKSSAIVMNGDDYDHTRKWPRLTAIDALNDGERKLITITATNRGTRLFFNGTVAGEREDWRLSMPRGEGRLRLVLGNSVYGKHGWDGDIHGLAVYKRGFSPAELGDYHGNWVKEKSFPSQPDDDLLLLFTFGEGEGSQIHDESGHDQPLFLPSIPVQFKKEFLSVPWHGFSPNRGFFIDTIINLLGFMPLGIVLCYWLKQWRVMESKTILSAVVLFGFTLSLSIELLQGWLPDRSSSLLDLCLNTAGAWLGSLIGSRA